MCSATAAVASAAVHCLLMSHASYHHNQLLPHMPYASASQTNTTQSLLVSIKEGPKFLLPLPSPCSRSYVRSTATKPSSTNLMTSGFWWAMAAASSAAVSGSPAAMHAPGAVMPMIQITRLRSAWSPARGCVLQESIRAIGYAPRSVGCASIRLMGCCYLVDIQQTVFPATGDHEQLRPKPQYYPLEAASGKGYDLDVSLFERLARTPGFPVVTLEQQRRMRPDISRLIRAPVYPSLRDHTSVTLYPVVKGMTKPLFMLTHNQPEGGQGEEGGQSKYNRYEVEWAVALAEYLVKQGYNKDGDLVILTPYVGQLKRLKAAVATSNIRVIIDENDSDQLAQLEDQEEAAVAAGGAEGAASSSGAAGASGTGGVHRTDSSSTVGSSRGAVGGGGSVTVADMGSCLRLATIDNFQVGVGLPTEHVLLDLIGRHA
eukprot:GHUV01026715.1.p1 GENE.GHUV01026715.1~~GHUV01026715.1.p1  ORF type:complete len:430 (+),score=88.69 GHUV01026715.1:146-1435(+)